MTTIPGERKLNRPVTVFSDFDGTISIRDIGYHLFHHFSNGRNDEYIPAWKSGAMTSREILTAEAALCDIDLLRMQTYLDTHALDSSLGDFLNKVLDSGGEFIILSDGLRLYIDYLLDLHGMQLPVIANEATIAGNRLHVSFPHENRHCRSCGCCKRERIAEMLPQILLKNPDTKVVFIGDGMSDRCVVDPAWPNDSRRNEGVKRLQNRAQSENIPVMLTPQVTAAAITSHRIIPPLSVYAKKDLARFCDYFALPYHPFQTFADIATHLHQEGVW